MNSNFISFLMEELRENKLEGIIVIFRTLFINSKAATLGA